MPADSRSSPTRRKAFAPRNTLGSPHKPKVDASEDIHNLLSDWLDDHEQHQQRNPASGMVRERTPTRTSSGQHLSPQKRQPLANISAKMQNPTPPRDDNQAEKTVTPGGVEFGKAGPLRNPLKKSPPNIFMPKKNAPPNRPAQHRVPSSSSLPQAQPEFRYPNLPGQQLPIPQQVPIPQFKTINTNLSIPTNPTPRTIYPPPMPTFSSSSTNSNPYAAYVPPRPAVVDMTRQQVKPKPIRVIDSDSDDDGERFDPDAEIRANAGRFGAPDPYMYLDSKRADEDMKKLLEGAFDDETEKSKIRLRARTRKVEKEVESRAKSLADKLSALSMKQEEESRQKTNEENEEEEEEDGTVEGLAVKLLPHQVEGVSWMIDKEIGQKKTRGILPKGGILADDMGLGKTVQSLTLILTNPRPAPDAKPEHKKQKLPGKEVGKGTLVVAPLALIKQWESEIKTKVTRSHALKVLVHHGPSRTKNAAELKKYDVVITTYQTLTSEHAGSNMTSEYGSRMGCFGVHWYRIMLDEAHSIKNRNAKSTLACCALPAWYRWCLTGTPMQNNLDELQSLVKFLQIKPYCDLPRWKEAITTPMKNGRGGLAMQRLQVFLKAFMKRRTKDILKQDGALNFGGKAATGEDGQAKNGGMQIVKREVLTVECDFDPDEKQYYDRLQARADERLEQMKRSEKSDYMGALVLLLRLRQMCDHPQLIEMAMAKDNDALTTGLPSSKQRTDDDDIDALTALMSGVSVEAKNCDICQIKLSSQEAGAGAVRCSECESDLAAMKAGRSGKKSKKSKPTSEAEAKPKPRQARNRKIVIDSGDEESEGEWIGKGPERKIDLGSDNDEDADGGGESLNPEDSERSDDEDSGVVDSPSRARKLKVVDSDDETEISADEEGDGEPADVSEAEEDDGSDSNQSGFLEGVGHRGTSKHQPSTKIRQLLRILHAETPKHKTIVFSQFTTMLDLIEPHLRHANIRFVRYDGSMRPDAREQSLSSLKTDKRTRVLLCSLKCGSLGLNLTAASRVVIVEPFWNPFVEEQAIDRVHRLNQTVDVKVFRLTIRDSVEERILELQEKKRELAKAAIEGGKGMGNLTMKDILGLFKRDAEHVEHANDREYLAKFGADGRLLDGPGMVSASDQVRDLGGASRGIGMAKRRIEDPVYGRRW